MNGRIVGLLVALALVAAAPARGDEYAVVITGASGAPEYADRFNKWRATFVGVLLEQFDYPPDHVMVLADKGGPGTRPATREHVKAVMDEVSRRATADDLVLVLLMGHGSVFEGSDAKFNLVGPDLTTEEWAALVQPVAARLVFVNATAGSSAFVRRLAGRNRVIVTATNSPAQRFTTVFPEFFVEAFAGPGADVNRDGRVSLWEAFEYASAGVRASFRDRGQPATERALLDDTGTGAHEAGAPPPAGALARTTYLQPGTSVRTGDPEADRLGQRRRAIESAIQSLHARRADMAAQAFETELEKLLLDLARIDQEIRAAP